MQAGMRAWRGMLLIGFSAWLSAAPMEAALRVDSFLALVREGGTYDGREIAIEGEAVGDVMVRGSYAWINVRSPEDVALGVIVTPDQARRILRTGDYFHAGDHLRVTGTFHRFAPRYGGETCVVAREMTVARKGFATPHPVARRRMRAASILAALTVISFMALAVKCRRGVPPSPIPPRIAAGISRRARLAREGPP